MVTRLYIGDLGADLLDDACRLVTEHGRQWVRVEPFHEMQVGMAETGYAGADQNLPRAWVRQADVLDHQRLVDFVQDGGLHRFLPRSGFFVE